MTSLTIAIEKLLDGFKYTDKEMTSTGMDKTTIIGRVERWSLLIHEILLENLATRASGVMATRHMTSKFAKAEEIDYLIGCGEEAVGDRSPTAHRANLFDMDMKFADVEKMEDVLAELERRFGRRAGKAESGD